MTMEIIIRKPSAGKTMELIDRSEAGNLYIVCADRGRVKNIVNMAKWWGKKIPFPITFDELLSNRLLGRHIEGLLIDDADDLLKRIVQGIPVHAITITGGIR